MIGFFILLPKDVPSFFIYGFLTIISIPVCQTFESQIIAVSN